MRTRSTFLMALAFLWLLAAPRAYAAGFSLAFDQLAASIANLSAADRSAVTEAIEFIRKGENQLALVRLSTLTEKNPKNSSLRILTAYTMLEVGNLVGAFEQAKAGEHSKDGNAYKCWFLGKVALLTGNTSVCEREISHVKGSGDLPAETKALEQDLQDLKAKRTKR